MHEEDEKGGGGIAAAAAKPVPAPPAGAGAILGQVGDATAGGVRAATIPAAACGSLSHPAADGVLPDTERVSRRGKCKAHDGGSEGQREVAPRGRFSIGQTLGALVNEPVHVASPPELRCACTTAPTAAAGVNPASSLL